MHIHDDLQAVIAKDTGSAINCVTGGVSAFKTNLSRRFGSYRLTRDTKAVQQNLESRLAAVGYGSRTSPGFKPETPVICQ